MKESKTQNGSSFVTWKLPGSVAVKVELQLFASHAVHLYISISKRSRSFTLIGDGKSLAEVQRTLKADIKDTLATYDSADYKEMREAVTTISKKLF